MTEPTSFQSNSRPKDASSAVPSSSKRSFHRHCFRCGWGFTFRSWKESHYCPRCGKDVKGRSPKRHRNDYLKRPQASHFGQTVRVDRAEDETFTFPSLPNLPIRQSASQLWQWMRSHPLASSAILGVGGTGSLLAGPALAAAGTALAALGYTIFTGVTIAGFVAVAFGAMKDCMQAVQAGGVLAVTGLVIGGVLMLIGSVIAVAGALLTGVGWIALATCLLILVNQAGHLADEHKEDIDRLIQAMRGKQLSKDAASASSEGVILPSDGREITLEEILTATEATLVEIPRAGSPND